jgi:hypothetical protein
VDEIPRQSWIYASPDLRNNNSRKRVLLPRITAVISLLHGTAAPGESRQGYSHPADQHGLAFARPGIGDTARSAQEAIVTDPRNAVDEVLDELHDLRLQIDAEFDYDPEKYLAYMREFGQQLLREGWKEAPPPPKRGKSAA